MNESRSFDAVARRVMLVVLAVVIAVPAGAAAQGRDYLLGQPYGSFGLRGGFALARAGSDVFDQITDDFTLERNDFYSFAGGADLAIRLTNRFDAVLGAAYMRSSAPSEDREFVGTDDLPIEQTTRLTRVPLTVSLKAYLTERGQRFGSLAWVPNRWAPYVGAGGGLMWHRFELEGEFVFVPPDDPDCLEGCAIYEDHLQSDGWAPTWHVFGGVEYSLSPRFALVGEARYSWASDEMNQDFAPVGGEGFEPIDLSGLQTVIGINVRF